MILSAEHTILHSALAQKQVTRCMINALLEAWKQARSRQADLVRLVHLKGGKTLCRGIALLAQAG